MSFSLQKSLKSIVYQNYRVFFTTFNYILKGLSESGIVVLYTVYVFLVMAFMLSFVVQISFFPYYMECAAPLAGKPLPSHF